MSFTFVPGPECEPYRPDTYQHIRESMITLLESVRDAMKAILVLETAQKKFDDSESRNIGPSVLVNLPKLWSHNNSMTVEHNTINFFSFIDKTAIVDKVNIIIDELKRTSINSPRLCSVHTYTLFTSANITLSNNDDENSYRTEKWHTSMEFTDSTDHWMEAVLKYDNDEMFMMAVSDIASKIDVSKVDIVSFRLDYHSLENAEALQELTNTINTGTKDVYDAAYKLSVLADMLDNKDWSLLDSPETVCEFFGTGTSVKIITAWNAWAS